MWPRSSRRTGGVPYTLMSSAMAGSTEDDGAEELVHLASLTPLTCVVGENPVPSRRQPRGPLGRHGDAVSERRCGVRCGAELMMSLGAVQAEKASLIVPVKRHRGEPGHTRDTRAHAGKRITQTNLTTIHPNPKTQTRTKTARPTQQEQPQEQPQARSRPVMRRRFGPDEEVNVAIAALVLGGPESVRVVCFSSSSQCTLLSVDSTDPFSMFWRPDP